MIIEIKPHREEKVEWKDIKKILDYLSKRFNVTYKEKLGDWEIYGVPKTEEDLKNE